MDKKPVMIMGATGCTGSALAEKLCRSGYRVGLMGRSQEKLAELKERLMACGAAEEDVATAICDATVYAQVEAALVRLEIHLGETYGLVNCVGSMHLKPAHITDIDDWQEVLDTNLNSCFYLLKAGIKGLRKTRGSVVFIASAAAQTGMSDHEAIAAAKAGVIGLTRSAAATYARSGIRVNCLAPGLVETNLTAAITSAQALKDASTAMHPLGRLGQPEDLAGAIAFLLSDQASWITGQVLGVDGGLANLRTKARA